MIQTGFGGANVPVFGELGGMPLLSFSHSICSDSDWHRAPPGRQRVDEASRATHLKVIRMGTITEAARERESFRYARSLPPPRPLNCSNK